MYLVIAEKPSVSQAIAKVIGAYKRKEGYLEGRDCLVSWCLGHLAEYAPPESYDSRYRFWQYKDLPIIPDVWELLVSEDKKEQFGVLKELLNRSDVEYVVNACDAGREGELIFRRVYELSGSHIPMKRLWISSMEDKAIEEGFSNLRDGELYDHLCQASVCRAQADWLIGMNATRAFTTTYGKKLTVGRVQSPTLAMLVERQNQMEQFQKEKYFNIHLDMGGWSVHKEKVFDRGEAERIVKSCKGEAAMIESVLSTEKSVSPPKLYDLTTLQRECNRYYGYTAQKTLQIVQGLYEQKLVTYPRTDSQFLTEDMGETAKAVIRQIVEQYGFTYPWEADVKRVMDNRKVTDHHAIIPTEELQSADWEELSKEEKNVLLLIAQRLLCATGQKHQYEETQIIVSCAGESFSVKGKTITEKGWKAVEEQYRKFCAMKESTETEKALPEVAEGQSVPDAVVTKTEHDTTPPKPYSEDTLLSAMETAGNKEFEEGTEKKGLGTPATRASIIEKLVTSQYAKRKGKQILPTEAGKELIAVLPEYLKSASMTAEWENQLLAMEKGEVSAEKFMDGITGLLTMTLNGCEALSEEEKQRFRSLEQIGTCPVCGSPVYEGKMNFYCSNRECLFALWKETHYLAGMKKTLDQKMAKELLEKGKTFVKNLYSVKKETYFDAELVLSVEDGKAKFSLEFPKRAVSKGKRKKK